MKFFLTLFLICLISLPALAQNPYLIENLVIELDAGTPELRREQALKKAAPEGLQKLLQRLTPVEDWHRHESIMNAIDIDDATEKFDIQSEEITEKNYRLTLNVLYDRKLIRRILTRMRQPFTEVVTGKNTPINADGEYTDLETMHKYEEQGGYTEAAPEMIRVDKPGRAFFSLVPQNPGQIETVKNELKNLSATREIKTKLISLQDTVFQVDFFGDIDAFVGSLRAAGISVYKDGGLWRVDSSKL